MYGEDDHILVYFDEHFKGYEFFYKDVKNNRAVVSKLVYDDEDECEDTAYLCLFSPREERDDLGFLNINIARLCQSTDTDGVF